MDWYLLGSLFSRYLVSRMSVLIQIQNLSKQYGTSELFSDASVNIVAGQKIGVIGRNGAGKSTFCKLITREEEADTGTIHTSKEMRLSYLQQHDPFSPDERVMEFLIRHTQKESWQCGKVAGSFQLKNELLEAKISELSGGYQTRVKLAAMLLEEPNFLILDEPTNYLDLNTLLLLEHFLRSFPGGFLIVSHDRAFLKRTSEHTLDVDAGQLFLFPGNIDSYLDFKDEQLQLQERQNKNIATKRKELETFVTRFRAKANKASQAQSKQKQLDKLHYVETRQPGRLVNIVIPKVETRKGFALTTTNLSVGYPTKTIAENVNLAVERGAKVAIVGDNGQGKTTFLRTVADDLKARGGTFAWKSGLKIAYYAQHVFQELPPDDSILNYLERTSAPDITRQQVLNLAGSFLFSGDQVDKPIRVLSGGEKARVCLAKMLLSKSDILLLDEPTNHLDFETVEGLGRALSSFPGTVFFVSHDRTFVQMVANNIIQVKDGIIDLYDGTYENYLYHLESALNLDGDQAEPTKQKSSPKNAAPTANKNRYKIKKELQSKRNKISKIAGKLESELETLQAERQEILDLFMSDSTAYSRERNERLEELNSLIEEQEFDWLETQEELENILSELETLH